MLPKKIKKLPKKSRKIKIIIRSKIKEIKNKEISNKKNKITKIITKVIRE